MEFEPRIANDRVEKATGHGWDYWIEVLDAMEGPKIGHTEMARRLGEKHGVGLWWCQSIAIEYEIFRGMRVPQQKTDGSFACSASRRVDRDPELVWADWTSNSAAEEWFGEGAEVSLEPGAGYSLGSLQGEVKRIRDDELSLFITLLTGGEANVWVTTVDSGKTQVQLHLTKLESEDEAHEWKGRIKELLDRYRDAVS